MLNPLFEEIQEDPFQFIAPEPQLSLPDRIHILRSTIESSQISNPSEQTQPTITAQNNQDRRPELNQQTSGREANIMFSLRGEGQQINIEPMFSLRGQQDGHQRTDDRPLFSLRGQQDGQQRTDDDRPLFTLRGQQDGQQRTDDRPLFSLRGQQDGQQRTNDRPLFSLRGHQDGQQRTNERPLFRLRDPVERRPETFEEDDDISIRQHQMIMRIARFHDDYVEDDYEIDEPLKDDELPEEEDDKEKACVICMSYKREYAFVPCGHRVLCAVCTKKQRKLKGICSICRKDFKTIIKIYL